jgi:hypothetical protein
MDPRALLNGMPGAADALKSMPGAADALKSMPGAADALKSMPGAADALNSGIGTLAGASGAAPAKSELAKTKEANAAMCGDFQKMFKENQADYGKVVFDSLGKYFQDEPSKARLTAMLELNIGNYIRSSQFRGTTAAVIKEAIGSVMRESLKTELKNPANFTGMCGEIQKLARGRKTYGGATRTRRKPRKKTVKRRN